MTSVYSVIGELFKAYRESDSHKALEVISNKSIDDFKDDLVRPGVKLLFSGLKKHLTTLEDEEQKNSNSKDEAGKKGDQGGIYDTADAFNAFIMEESNVQLYDAVHKALCDEMLLQHSTAKTSPSPNDFLVLDIGCGGGASLIHPVEKFAIEHPDCTVKVYCCEPGLDLLKALFEASSPTANHTKFENKVEWKSSKCSNLTYIGFNATVQDFISEPLIEGIHWDFAVSSFAMQNITLKEDRDSAFRFLRSTSKVFSLIEFDVNPIVNETQNLTSDDRIKFFIDTFAQGLERHAKRDDYELVSQGFLIPNILTKFCDEKANCTMEQPTIQWTKELEEAGFRIDRSAYLLYQYWWSACKLIPASSPQ